MEAFTMLLWLAMYTGQIMGIVFICQNREHKKGWVIFVAIMQILCVLAMIGLSMD